MSDAVDRRTAEGALTATADIVGIGGAHVDRIGHVRGSARPGASNPGTMAEWVGGCMANTLRVARALGRGTVALVSARGGDGAGRLVAEALADAGIADRSAVFLDRTTPSYTAIMDGGGEVLAALADMDLYETGLPRHLRRAEPRALLAGAGLLVVDANLPAATLEALAADVAAPLVALAVSPAKAPRLAGCAPRCALAFMNRRELHALAGAPATALTDEAALDALARLGIGRAVVSDGPRPVLVRDGGRTWRQPAGTLAAPIADVTGAGDALAGAVLAAWRRDGLERAVRLGIAAAAATIAVPGPFRADIAACDLPAMAAALPPPETLHRTASEDRDATHAP